MSNEIPYAAEKNFRRAVKRNRAGASAANSGKQRQPDLPYDRTDDIAYDVAVLAWKEGLTANSISKRLFGDSSSLHIMRVKRALQRALKTMLHLRPPLEDELRQRIEQVVNRGHQGRRVSIYVVSESEVATGAPVYAKAAELITEFIQNAIKLCRRPGDKRQLVICNAGGRTVAETVKALARNPPIRVDCETRESQASSDNPLIFVAGNAACEPAQFHR